MCNDLYNTMNYLIIMIINALFDLIQAGCDMGGHYDCDIGRDKDCKNTLNSLFSGFSKFFMFGSFIYLLSGALQYIWVSMFLPHS